MQYFSILSIYIYTYVKGSRILPFALAAHWTRPCPQGELIDESIWMVFLRFKMKLSSTGCLIPKEVSATPMHPNGWRRSRFSSPSSCGMGPWATRFTTIADGCLPHRKSPRQLNGGTWQMEISEITLIYLQNSTVFPYFHLPRLPRISC